MFMIVTRESDFPVFEMEIPHLVKTRKIYEN